MPNPFKHLAPRFPLHLNINPKFKRFLVSFFSILVIVVTITATLSFFLIYLPGINLYRQIQKTQTDSQQLQAAIQSKNIDQIKQQLDSLKDNLGQITKSYSKFSYLKVVPYAKDYYSDGSLLLDTGTIGIDTGQILLTAIEPYKDFLGLEGSATSSAQTTEDRITFLTQSVESILPHLDDIESKVEKINNNLSQIDPSRYPDQIKNFKIQSNILKAQELSNSAYTLVKDGKPILTKISWLLGKDDPRHYLLLFQNDAELRPTGGFWTAYGVLKVDNGKITPLVSEDIYHLDERFSSTIPAPRPLKAYHINVPYLNLRDMNLSPDFPTSVEQFLGHYQKLAPTPKIDVVVALDTQVLVDLVEVLGRIGVPGFGNFSSEPDKRCDGCPQIIYQLEWIAGRPRNYIEENRKGFLGPLMHSILSNAMGSEKEKIGPLAQATIKNINQKHVLFYFLDPDIQQAGNLANITGQIKTTDSSTDYFALIDANMASAKSNLFIRQQIRHEIVVNQGKVEHKIAVKYTNPTKASNCNLEKGDLCLNAPKYRDWFRFYVPTGSQLIEMKGSEVEPVVYEELGKQVFEGFYGDKYPLYAESSSKTSIQYTSSVLPSPNYQIFLQKQAGTKPIEYQLYVNGKLYDTFSWLSDKTIKLNL